MYTIMFYNPVFCSQNVDMCTYFAMVLKITSNNRLISVTHNFLWEVLNQVIEC
jgi:hypothetical protein